VSHIHTCCGCGRWDHVGPACELPDDSDCPDHDGIQGEGLPAPTFTGSYCQHPERECYAVYSRDGIAQALSCSACNTLLED
jgi:hypothetical protein